MNELGRAKVFKMDYDEATRSLEPDTDDPTVNRLPSWAETIFVYLPLVAGLVMVVSSLAFALVFAAPLFFLGIGMILVLIGIFVVLIKR